MITSTKDHFCKATGSLKKGAEKIHSMFTASSRGKLTVLFIVSKASKKLLQISADHILSSADKQQSC